MFSVRKAPTFAFPLGLGPGLRVTSWNGALSRTAPQLAALLEVSDIVLLQDTRHHARDRLEWVPGFTAVTNAVPKRTSGWMNGSTLHTPPQEEAFWGLVFLVRHGLSYECVMRSERGLAITVRDRARHRSLTVCNVYVPTDICEIACERTLRRWGHRPGCQRTLTKGARLMLRLRWHSAFAVPHCTALMH